MTNDLTNNPTPNSSPAPGETTDPASELTDNAATFQTANLPSTSGTVFVPQSISESSQINSTELSSEKRLTEAQQERQKVSKLKEEAEKNIEQENKKIEAATKALPGLREKADRVRKTNEPKIEEAKQRKAKCERDAADARKKYQGISSRNRRQTDPSQEPQNQDSSHENQQEVPKAGSAAAVATSPDAAGEKRTANGEIDPNKQAEQAAKKELEKAEAEVQKATQEIAKLEDEIKIADKDVEAAKSQIAESRQRITSLQSEIKTYDSQLAALDKEIDLLTESITLAEQEKLEQKEKRELEEELYLTEKKNQQNKEGQPGIQSDQLAKLEELLGAAESIGFKSPNSLKEALRINSLSPAAVQTLITSLETISIEEREHLTNHQKETLG